MELDKLFNRKQEALKNAKKFINDDCKYNSFIKLSNNIQEEITNLTKIQIEKDTNLMLRNSPLRDLKYNLMDEERELNEYIDIYLKNGFKEHYEVNDYITKNNLWDNFSNMRSLNDHRGCKNILGILPKFYAQVCKRLNIEGAGGSPLDNATHY